MILPYKQIYPLNSYYVNETVDPSLQLVDETITNNLEDIRYYSRALTENEITNIYENGRTFGITQDIDISNLEVRFPFANDISGVEVVYRLIVVPQ